MRRRRSAILRPGLLLAFTTSLGLGCDARTEGAPATESRAPILVLAASDLQHALPVLAERYEATRGRRIQIVLGSTGNLTTQIENGAPGDVFLAASESFIDRLDGAGLIRSESRHVYAVGRVVVTWAPGVVPPRSLEDLANGRFEAIAIANPEHAPYGQAAREALEAVGILDLLQHRLVLGENVSQALQFVRSGNADSGIVALSVALGVPEMEYFLVDPRLHRPLRQAGALLRDAPNPAAGLDFLDFVASDEGQTILRRHGFEAP